MSKIIDDLVRECDERTTRALERWTPSIRLLGDTEAPFLKSVARKAKQLGIEVFGGEGFIDAHCVDIIDQETYEGPWDVLEYPWADDPDRLLEPDQFSSCAEALWRVLDRLGTAGKYITIVGRGHAVQGLAKALSMYGDATVTVAHSMTPVLVRATLFADILVIAAPIEPGDVLLGVQRPGPVVLDLVGKCKGSVREDMYYGDIGRLTVSVLLNRVAEDSYRAEGAGCFE